MSERQPIASCETALPTILAALPNMFRGPLFRQTSRYRYRAKIDGIKVGVVVAARTWRFDNHALGTSDFDRLLEYKSDGKIDFAFVVAARSLEGQPPYLCRSPRRRRAPSAFEGSGASRRAGSVRSGS